MTPVIREQNAGRAVGQMFFAAFGTWWMIDWCLQRHGADWATLALILFAGGSLFLWAWIEARTCAKGAESRLATSETAARQRAFRRINMVQWLTIAIAVVALNATGHAHWVVPAILLIVGLHFIPLAWVFSAPRHYATGAALVGVALAYPWIAESELNYPSGEFAAGAVLWISAMYGRLRTHGEHAAAELPTVQDNRPHASN